MRIVPGNRQASALRTLSPVSSHISLKIKSLGMQKSILKITFSAIAVLLAGF